MKKIIFLFLAIFTMLTVFAGKYGYYKTYEDFSKGKLIEYSKETIWTDWTKSKAVLVLVNSGQRTEIYIKDIYDYLMDGELYRPTPVGSHPGARVVLVGEYMMYTTQSPGGGYNRENPHIVFVSKALNTKMHFIGEFYKNLDNIAAEDPDMVKLNNGIKSIKGAYIHNRIVKYIMAAPGYVKNVKDVIPVSSE